MQMSLTRESNPGSLVLFVKSGLDADIPHATAEVEVRSTEGQRLTWHAKEVVGIECDWLPTWAQACLEAYLWGSEPHNVTAASARVWQQARDRIAAEPDLAQKHLAWQLQLRQRRVAEKLTRGRRRWGR